MDLFWTKEFCGLKICVLFQTYAFSSFIYLQILGTHSGAGKTNVQIHGSPLIMCVFEIKTAAFIHLYMFICLNFYNYVWVLESYILLCLGLGKYFWASPGGSVIRNMPAMQELQKMRAWSLGWEDPMEKGMETHSSFLACRTLRTEELGATFHSVTKNWVWLKWLSMHTG